MDARRDDWEAWVRERQRTGGLGACCAEAQADGVPCLEPGRDCAECGRAMDAFAATGGEPPPYPPAALSRG